MNTFFLDSSALAKRYLIETGSTWILALTDLPAGYSLFLAEITWVEVAAALAARHRAPGGITRQERDGAVRLLSRHCATQYRLISLDRPILSRAVRLTQQHRLRGYDAVRLSTALATNNALITSGLPGLTFVAADGDLVAAAHGEGLAADDPNLHP